MSITLNGRVIQVILKQNTGNTGVDGAELDISSYVLTLGSLSWSVDENLTKLSLGNLSLTVTDDESSTVWNFILNNTVSAEGILPPWLTLDLDGVQKFIGVIKEAPVRTQDSGTLEISLNAVDWSSMLESKRVEASDTSMSRINDFRKEVSYAAGPSISCNSDYNKELRRGHYRQTVYLNASELNNFNVNDWVYFNNYSSFGQYNKKYQVLAVYLSAPDGQGTRLTLTLGSGFWWSENPGDIRNGRQYSTLNRLYASTSPNLDITTNLPTFVANETFSVSTAGKTPKTSIVLTYVDGLQPGDKLDKITNFQNASDATFSVTIVDVDPITNTIYLDNPLSNDLTAGVTSFQINKDSIQESVLVPLLPLVEKAVRDIAMVDWSSYQAATLPAPCFSFISPKSPATQNTHTEALVGITDLQPSLTDFQVKGSTGSWSGLPSVGWDTFTWAKKVNWTEQVTSAPAYLMPYLTTPADADPETVEKRGYTRYAGLEGRKDERDRDPGKGNGTTPVYKTVYDYSNLRAYQFKFSPSLSNLTVQSWNGSTWSAVNGFTTTGIGSPLDILPFKDAVSSVASGYGLLALYADGTIKTILSTVSLSATLTGEDIKDSNGKLQVKLKQTSNGLYYITPSGYGQIYITGGVLRSKWVKLIDNSNLKNTMRSITPILSTFVYANGRIITLAKVSYKNSITDERFIDDTYLLQLNKDIQNNAADSVISVDFIVKNLPRTTMAVKSPVSEDVFGFMGGRLFQITKSLPDTVERFTSLNQTAQAIIEFACAMTNTVASPLVTGKLKIYSRGFNNTPTNVTVDQVSIKETRWSQHMASTVVIKGADEKKGVAVSTTQKSGLTISYSNDVYIRNSSQAQAIAQSYLFFFEKPRKEVEQVWFSQSFPAPWESLEPMQIITINGGTQQYYLIGLNHDLETQTATVNLLEVL